LATTASETHVRRDDLLRARFDVKIPSFCSKEMPWGNGTLTSLWPLDVNFSPRRWRSLRQTVRESFVCLYVTFCFHLFKLFVQKKTTTNLTKQLPRFSFLAARPVIKPFGW